MTYKNLQEVVSTGFDAEKDGSPLSYIWNVVETVLH